ncbi:transmembrane protein 183A [Hyperolius riggenbachi]|uniref:transmembrane protein 183A n=1 Tax=Hyperolius riggenbachi TaxID=752182 RepID=UPI0035A373F6
MPRKGNRKRLNNRPDDLISHRVKALCGLESSQVSTEDGLFVLSEDGEHDGSNVAKEEDSEYQNIYCCKKRRSKKLKETNETEGTGDDYPFDIWLVLANYIRPEDVVTFALICKKAWTVTCTAVFWMRLYKRYYRISDCLPVRLLPECMYRLRSLRVCVIRTLYHMYEPFCSRLSKSPALPDSTPSALLNSKCLLFWYKKVTGNRVEPLWEFNFKLKKLAPKRKNHCFTELQPPTEYKEVNFNPDNDCCLLQVTTLNFIFIPVVMGMILTYMTINVSTDMRHHRVRMVFQDCPMLNGKKTRGEQGTQMVLDPVHSVHLLDWWHPKYPFSTKA